ncbi:MAG: ATP-binding protein [Roseobacter sp.]|uniref:ATP-binding protein n=1 Tax=Sulfitobacter sp. TaxID=1903071 RepID=UPI00329A3FD5
MQAVRNGISVSYRMVSRLLEEFELARIEGTAPRLRAKYRRADLLILDDFGVSKLKAAGKHDLLELLDDRIGERATIVCGQLPVENWHAFIDNPTIADAILDRLTSAAHRIELSGQSLRRKVV